MIDFKCDDAGDLVIENGDLVLTESTLQHQKDIVWAGKAWYHHAPTLGVDLQSYLNESASAPGLVRVIRQELEKDGMTVNSIAFGDGDINIDAIY